MPKQNAKGLSQIVCLFVLLGQIISNKKEELMSILDHFNIQVGHGISFSSI